MDEATRISLKDQFNSLLVRAIEGRRGGMALMRVLEELDFYNSPASAKHHLNVPGGLVMHSLNVARAALELCDKMPQFAKCNKGAVLTAALLHDVCKAGQYIKKPDGSYRYGWTDIGEWTDTKGKKHKAADSPRYKALGNSIALPQWFWIAQKMKSYMGDGAKLGSLFDGIGGFPLVWETTYGIGTARWASEIEEFPIAVTKKRFPERKEYEN